jgi:hypothetical protein
MKILPAVAELLHADEKTDIEQLIVAFRNFAKAPINHNLSRTLQAKSGLDFLLPIELSPLPLMFYITTVNKQSIIKQLRILTLTTICL